jgi:hypothetical protein
MSGFEVFAGGFLLGAFPGAFVLLRVILEAQRELRTVERVAFEEGRPDDPIFLVNASARGNRDFQVDPSAILRDGETPRLRQAKQSLLQFRRTAAQRARSGIYILFAGAIAGAAVGYLVARKLGLPIS